MFFPFLKMWKFIINVHECVLGRRKEFVPRHSGNREPDRLNSLPIYLRQEKRKCDKMNTSTLRNDILRSCIFPPYTRKEISRKGKGRGKKVRS